MKKNPDYFLLGIVGFSIFFGILFLSCLSSYESLQRWGNTNYYLFHQLALAVVAVVLGFVAYKTPLDFFKKTAPILVILNLIALFFVFLPGIGTKIWGASRWVSIGGHGFQPSEFLKITSILYLSAWIASKLSEANVSGWKLSIKKNYHDALFILLPFLIFLGLISVALILQKDATTLGIITVTLLAVYFSSKTPLWHAVLIIILGVAALCFMIKIEPYRLDRLMTFLNPEEDPMGRSYHLKQSLISVGSGGIIGKGLGMSNQKFGFLPTAISDAVFSVIGEELGMVGGFGIVALFGLFFWRGLHIAKKSTDKFAKLTATGISFWIVFQAFINIASAIGMFLFVGIPLPFFSYGGSHLVAEIIAVGILLNISKNG
jgi:cell division protein FtsW